MSMLEADSYECAYPGCRETPLVGAKNCYEHELHERCTIGAARALGLAHKTGYQDPQQDELSFEDEYVIVKEMLRSYHRQ